MKKVSSFSKLNAKVIRIQIADMRALYQAYMPFIEGCGIFHESDQSFNLGEEVFVFLSLPDDLGRFACAGEVVWLNPPSKAMKRVPGIGIKLRGRDVENIHDTIEKGLGKNLNTGLPTATL